MVESSLQPFGMFLRDSEDPSASISGVSERLGYGFYGTNPIRYSPRLLMTVGNHLDVVSCAHGFVQMRPTPAPGYKARLKELVYWFDESLMEGYLQGLSIDPELDRMDDMKALLGRFSRINLFLELEPKHRKLLTPIIGDIQFIVYRNLNPESVFEALKANLEKAAIARIKGKLPANWSERTRELFGFFFFWVTNQKVPVKQGDKLGKAQAFAPDETIFGMEVWHHDGPIDPVYFLETLRVRNLLASNEEQRWEQVKATVSTSGKIFSPNQDTTRITFDPGPINIESNTFKDHIVPYPILKRLQATLPKTPDGELTYHSKLMWRELGDKQVTLYIQRLIDLAALRRDQLRPDPERPGPLATEDDLLDDEDNALQARPDLKPFHFDNADWRNIFQLEAIVEFYLNYETPLDTSTLPILPGTAGSISVDLVNATDLPGLPKWARPEKGGQLCNQRSSDLFLVVIDDFRLVGGNLPLQKMRGLKKDNTEWEAIDEYRGMMFIVKRGEVLAKHRFTSYTSKMHKNLQPRSSIKGNQEYGFFSKIAGGKAGINYSFLVVDKNDFLPKTELPGRTYFDPPVRKRDKGSIMIHNGYERSSGSEGCQVSSGAYYAFRRDLIGAVLDDPSEIRRLNQCYPSGVISDLRKVKRLGHDDSKKYWREANRLKENLEALGELSYPGDDPSAVEIIECVVGWRIALDAGIDLALQAGEISIAFDEDYVLKDEWDGLIFGKYYLIRPAEKHLGWGA